MVIGINGQRCDKKSCEMCERCVYDEGYVEDMVNETKTEKTETKNICNGCEHLSLKDVCGHKQAYCKHSLSDSGREIALKIVNDEKEDIQKPFWCHKKEENMKSDTNPKSKFCNGCLNFSMNRKNGMNYAYCKGCTDKKSQDGKIIEVTGGILDLVKKPEWCILNKKDENKTTVTVMETNKTDCELCNGCPRFEFKSSSGDKERMFAYCKYPNGSLSVIESKVKENAPIKKPEWCQIELDKKNNAKTCNSCAYSRTNSYSENGDDCVDWYCHRETMHPLCIKLKAENGEIVEPPKGFCPLTKKNEEINKTKHKMTWLERKEAWKKIKPLIDFKDIKIGEVYHLPPILDDKRCDILIVSKTDYQITYKKLNDISSAYYTFYPSSLEYKFLTQHKIKKIDVKKVTSVPQTREYPSDYYDDYDY